MQFYISCGPVAGQAGQRAGSTCTEPGLVPKLRSLCSLEFAAWKPNEHFTLAKVGDDFREALHCQSQEKVGAAGTQERPPPGRLLPLHVPEGPAGQGECAARVPAR